MVNLKISLKWKDFFLLFVVTTELMALIFKLDVIHLSIKPFIIPSLILVFLKKSLEGFGNKTYSKLFEFVCKYPSFIQYK